MKLNILTVVALFAGCQLLQAAEYGYLSFTGTTRGVEYDDETITLYAGDRIEFLAASNLNNRIEMTLPDSSKVNLGNISIEIIGSRGGAAREIVGPGVIQMSSPSSMKGSSFYASYKITRAGR